MKERNFTVQIKIVAIVDVDVQATTLKEAIDRGSDVKPSDLLRDGVEVWDSRREVIGVIGVADNWVE